MEWFTGTPATEFRYLAIHQLCMDSTACDGARTSVVQLRRGGSYSASQSCTASKKLIYLNAPE